MIEEGKTNNFQKKKKKIIDIVFVASRILIKNPLQKKVKNQTIKNERK